MRRASLVVVLGVLFASIGLLAGAVSASANTGIVRTVVNADIGVYWRGDPPDWGSPIVNPGYGVYNGDQIELECWTAGSTVPPYYNNPLWYDARVVGGRGLGEGFVNDHFIDTGTNVPGVLVPGVPACSASAPSPPTPSPAAGLVFPVFHADGGVFYRRSPNWGDRVNTVGVGVYNGDSVQLICGAWGDAVGPNANRWWHYVNNLSRPSIGSGWVNDRFVDSPNVANQPTPGEPACSRAADGSGAVTVGGAPSARSGLANSFFNRTAAGDWARQHARDAQAYGAMCAWFVSRALWAAGFPKSQTWTNAGSFAGGPLPGSQPGTPTAWRVRQLIGYLRSTFSTTWTSLGSMDPSRNAMPEADVGDLIAYDWGDGNGISHIAIIVGFAPGTYPEVAEWGQFDWGFPYRFITNRASNPSSGYVKRGWTWSAKHGKWLQQVYGGRAKAYLLHFNGGIYVGHF